MNGCPMAENNVKGLCATCAQKNYCIIVKIYEKLEIIEQELAKSKKK